MCVAMRLLVQSHVICVCRLQGGYSDILIHHNCDALDSAMHVLGVDDDIVHRQGRLYGKGGFLGIEATHEIRSLFILGLVLVNCCHGITKMLVPSDMCWQ